MELSGKFEFLNLKKNKSKIGFNILVILEQLVCKLYNLNEIIWILTNDIRYPTFKF